MKHTYLKKILKYVTLIMDHLKRGRLK